MTVPISSSSSTSSSTTILPSDHATQVPPNSANHSVCTYVAPPIASSVAIVPVYRDLVAKSAQQKGQPIPAMTHREGMKKGVKAAPVVGMLVGSQLVSRSLVERVLVGSNGGSLASVLASSAIVGLVSAPVFAVYNGQTMGWTMVESLRRFTLLQGVAIAVLETTFVVGVSVADRLGLAMRRRFGDHRMIDYAAAFVTGAVGSLVGHPADTALTRWQNGMRVENFRQLMWGSARKARAIGSFSVLYKLVMDTLTSLFPPSRK
jgi:hypothetical protein